MLQLLSILFLVGMAEAKEIDEYLLIDHGNGMAVTCNDTLTKCWTECELKMKEAMKMADGKLFNRPPYTTPRSFEEREQRRCDDKEAWEQWDQITKKCVK